MGSTVIWVIGVAIEAVACIRAARVGMCGRYKLFYSYLFFVLVRDLGLFGVYYFLPATYPWSYWTTEILGVLLGCGLVWETYRVALAPYTGAARMARAVLPVLFIGTAARIFVKAWSGPNWIPGRTPLDTEIDLRVVQLALLIGLIALFFYYAIPLGRNLKGIVYGYALFLTANLIELMLRGSLGSQFQIVWQYLQPCSYLIVLLTWCVTLWSYAPAPQPPRQPNLERDYQTLVTATARKLRLARARTWKAIRS